MNIIIAGCGRVGEELTQQLSREKHSVTVVDTDAARLSDMNDQYDVMGVEGNCATRSVMEEAGVGKADLMIATTASDEQNLLACLLAKKLGAKHTIARVRDPDYVEQMDFLAGELGLSLYVNPEYSAATEFFRLLRFPSSWNIEVFAGGRAEIVEISVPSGSSLDGESLMNINKAIGARILVCSVMRDGEAFIPRGDFVLRAGDVIGVTGEPAEVNRAFRKLKLPLNRLDRVMLTGGGRMSYYLAKMLIGIGAEPTILERNEARCRELCELLPEAVIQCGESGNWGFLGEAGIDGMDGLCAMTGSDEENIVLGMYAASLHTVGKVIVKVNSGALEDLGKKAGLDSMLNPKHITAELILRYVRGMSNAEGANVETLHELCGGKAQALKFVVNEVQERITGVPLKDLKLRKNLLIACIIRAGKIVIPDGREQIHRGDQVLVVTTAKDVNGIRDILA